MDPYGWLESHENGQSLGITWDNIPCSMFPTCLDSVGKALKWAGTNASKRRPGPD